MAPKVDDSVAIAVRALRARSVDLAIRSLKLDKDLLAVALALESLAQSLANLTPIPLEQFDHVPTCECLQCARDRMIAFKL